MQEAIRYMLLLVLSWYTSMALEALLTSQEVAIHN